jgi:hypothetical protein
MVVMSINFAYVIVPGPSQLLAEVQSSRATPQLSTPPPNSNQIELTLNCAPRYSSIKAPSPSRVPLSISNLIPQLNPPVYSTIKAPSPSPLREIRNDLQSPSIVQTNAIKIANDTLIIPNYSPVKAPTPSPSKDIKNANLQSKLPFASEYVTSLLSSSTVVRSGQTPYKNGLSNDKPSLSPVPYTQHPDAKQTSSRSPNQYGSMTSQYSPSKYLSMTSNAVSNISPSYFTGATDLLYTPSTQPYPTNYLPVIKPQYSSNYTPFSKPLSPFSSLYLESSKDIESKPTSTSPYFPMTTLSSVTSTLHSSPFNDTLVYTAPKCTNPFLSEYVTTTKTEITEEKRTETEEITTTKKYVSNGLDAEEANERSMARINGSRE